MVSPMPSKMNRVTSTPRSESKLKCPLTYNNCSIIRSASASDITRNSKVPFDSTSMSESEVINVSKKFKSNKLSKSPSHRNKNNN